MQTWRTSLTEGCPKLNAFGLHERCDIVMPDLPKVLIPRTRYCERTDHGRARQREGNPLRATFAVHNPTGVSFPPPTERSMALGISLPPSSAAEIVEDPQRLLDAMQQRLIITLDDVGYTIVPTSAIRADIETDEVEDMVSLRTNLTGVDNTVFVSTKGYSQHAPRIKIAIDPPDSLNAAGKNASMAIHDFSISGAHMPPALVDQAVQFINNNRPVLLDYWEAKIDTAELLQRVRRG